ncbi:AraC family transcriptional regulator [Bacillus suaedae]|uniref:Helix-turn-helix transcriptional regulator n=1 Tax=Halalkalibacter suaedae TaxID=2822140 RepID=A0A940WQY3_9BACI|nr:AraC family transcriptional regulator [Bacillus suaedae]MBP3950885.1 helix-turn-helix transcriptional regulator [Bacillus suaedae]
MNEFTLPSYSLPLVREIGFMIDKKGSLQHPSRFMEEVHVFIYVKKGMIYVVEDGIDYQVKEGTYLFLSKNTPHWGTKTYAPGTQWYYIHFYDPPQDLGVENKGEYSPFQQPMMIHSETYDKKLTIPKRETVQKPEYIDLQLQKLLDRYESQHSFQPLRSSALTYDLFLDLYQEKLDEKIHKRSNRIVNQLIELLKKAPTDRLSSEQISEKLGMNYAYISNLFRQQTGKTVTQFQHELLVEQAIRYFKESSHNVSEVSEILGFSNPFYFSRVFKKVSGISPSDYLNQHYR